VEVIMSTLHRAQILLESEQHQALAEIAEQEGRSISDLVREIVRQHLAERRQQAQQLAALEAIERLTQIRARLQEERGLYQGDPLAEVRAEWEKDVERTWQGDA
jgi:predicted DNA-binding protein